MQLGILALFVLAPITLVIVWSKSAYRWGKDPEIDSLIALNKAKPCVEKTDKNGKVITRMETIDWQKANRAGERAWHQKLRAQRRYSTVVVASIGKTETRVN